MVGCSTQHHEKVPLAAPVLHTITDHRDCASTLYIFKDARLSRKTLCFNNNKKKDPHLFFFFLCIYNKTKTFGSARKIILSMREVYAGS